MTREETDPGIREAILDTSSRIGNARPAGTIPPTAGDVADEFLVRALNGKSSKGTKAIIALAGVLLGSGGIVGSYYATKALATKNAGTLDEHEERLDASEKAIGEIGGKYFMLRAYTGLKEEQRASREMKDRFGALAYLADLGTWRCARRYRTSW